MLFGFQAIAGRTRSGKEAAAPQDEREWTAEDTKWEKELRKCKFEPTRFAHRGVLEEMGILDDFDELMVNMGFGTFHTKAWDLYEKPAREFLATVKLMFPNETQDAVEGTISFFIGKNLTP